MTEQELPPDLSDWLNSQEYVDRYNAYITQRIEEEKQFAEVAKKRDLELEAQEERRRKLREEYEASPAYKIEVEIKKLKEERSIYIKKYIQPLHDALSDMGAVCNYDDHCCNRCDDDDDWHY
jgi:hypothetical protein